MQAMGCGKFGSPPSPASLKEQVSLQLSCFMILILNPSESRASHYHDYSCEMNLQRHLYLRCYRCTLQQLGIPLILLSRFNCSPSFNIHVSFLPHSVFILNKQGSMINGVKSRLIWSYEFHRSSCPKMCLLERSFITCGRRGHFLNEQGKNT